MAMPHSPGAERCDALVPRVHALGEPPGVGLGLRAAWRRGDLEQAARPAEAPDGGGATKVARRYQARRSLQCASGRKYGQAPSRVSKHKPSNHNLRTVGPGGFPRAAVLAGWRAKVQFSGPDGVGPPRSPSHYELRGAADQRKRSGRATARLGQSPSSTGPRTLPFRHTQRRTGVEMARASPDMSFRASGDTRQRAYPAT